MGLETGSFISDLNDTWPVAEDGLNQSDDHHRLEKRVMKNTFPGSGGNGFSKAITATEDELNFSSGVTSGLQAQIDALLVLVANGEVPVGCSIPYTGLFANIPANYNLSDGTNGTANLTDKFIYGTNTESEIGDTGGSADSVLVAHAHTANHNHTGSSGNAGARNNPMKVTNSLDSGSAEGIDITKNILSTLQNSTIVDPTPDHSHTVTVDNANVTTSSSGVSGVGTNLPTYLKLAYIQRMS